MTTVATVKKLWEDCTVAFECPNCGAELVADSQSELERCDCGLSYGLYVKVYIQLPLPEEEEKDAH